MSLNNSSKILERTLHIAHCHYDNLLARISIITKPQRSTLSMNANGSLCATLLLEAMHKAVLAWGFEAAPLRQPGLQWLDSRGGTGSLATTASTLWLRRSDGGQFVFLWCLMTLKCFWILYGYYSQRRLEIVSEIFYPWNLTRNVAPLKKTRCHSYNFKWRSTRVRPSSGTRNSRVSR